METPRASLGHTGVRLTKLPTAFMAFATEVLEPRVLPLYRQGSDRRWHGAVHICRCLIFSEAMLGCYQHDLRVAIGSFDSMAVRLALAWSEAARSEASGWEAESAHLATEFLRSVHVNPDYAEYVSSLITHQRTDPNAALVEACGTLDLLRLQPLWAYNVDKLAFLHPTQDPVAPGNGTAKHRRTQFIPEAKAWIQHTETLNLADAPTCCQSLLQDLADHREQFPTLAGWLNDLL